MEGKPQPQPSQQEEPLSEKELNQIRAEKDKFVSRMDKLMKSKDKPEDAILKELYTCFTEKAKAKLQKTRDIQANLKRVDMLVSDKAGALVALDKHKKNTVVLKGLNSTLEKQNNELQEEYKKIVGKHQEQRKEINEKMQAEIKAVQEEMEQEVHRKQILARENESLADRIKELKEMLSATNENVEKNLCKSEFYVEKL